jgi:hypothetical protein
MCERHDPTVGPLTFEWDYLGDPSICCRTTQKWGGIIWEEVEMQPWERMGSIREAPSAYPSGEVKSGIKVGVDESGLSQCYQISLSFYGTLSSDQST